MTESFELHHHIYLPLSGEYFGAEDPATRERRDMVSSVAVYQDPDRAKTVSTDIPRPVSCISWGRGSSGTKYKEGDCV